HPSGRRARSARHPPSEELAAPAPAATRRRARRNDEIRLMGERRRSPVPEGNARPARRSEVRHACRLHEDRSECAARRVTARRAALSQREGRSIDGIVGYNVISRFIVEIDYAGHQLRFFDPATWKAPHDAVELPFVFHGNTPIARVPLTTRDGRTVVARLEV